MPSLLSRVRPSSRPAPKAPPRSGRQRRALTTPGPRKIIPSCGLGTDAAYLPLNPRPRPPPPPPSCPATADPSPRRWPRRSRSPPAGRIDLRGLQLRRAELHLRPRRKLHHRLPLARLVMHRDRHPEPRLGVRRPSRPPMQPPHIRLPAHLDLKLRAVLGRRHGRGLRPAARGSHRYLLREAAGGGEERPARSAGIETPTSFLATNARSEAEGRRPRRRPGEERVVDGASPASRRRISAIDIRSLQSLGSRLIDSLHCCLEGCRRH